MKVLYYDCFAGISGDMNLGAMIDLGVDVNFLTDQLKKLKLENYRIDVARDIRKGISGTKLTVQLNTSESKDGTPIITAPIHLHSTKHNSLLHNENHSHRSFADIKNIINNSTLSPFIKEKSIQIFQKVAEAEGKIHNKPIEQVHFHEVGALDSIIDIVGAAICLEYLKVEKIVASTIQLGGGTVNCAHGVYPVPAPATAEILKGIPVKAGIVNVETTTPTGAAILATIVNEFTDNYSLIISKTGYGIGHRDTEIPNVLRVYLAEESVQQNTNNFQTAHNHMITECNIDDMNPEFYDYLFEKLFEAGADDVYLTPIIMKKSRPASKLSVLFKKELEKQITEILISETSTIGVRSYVVEKTAMERELKTIDTKYGKIRIKVTHFENMDLKFKPEYEDCVRIAKENKKPLRIVYDEILSICRNELNL